MQSLIRRMSHAHAAKTSLLMISMVLAGCSEPETVVIDASDVNLNPTQAELEAIFGVDPDPVSPVQPPRDDTEEEAEPIAFGAGPQSLSEFSDADLADSAMQNDTVDGLFYQRSNNTALLNGPVFGTGERLNSDIRRVIPFTLKRQAAGLELLAVYLLQGNNTSVLDTDIAMGIVRNTSPRTHCYIKAGGITLLDRQGNPINDFIVDRAYIKGASGTSSPGRDIPDASGCLGAGDVGYMRARMDTDLEAVGGIAINQLDFLDREFVIPTPTMIPLTYDVNDSGMSVSVTNQSTVRLKMTGIDSVYLDEQGLPLGLDRWNPYPAVTLAPGEEFVFDVEADFRGSTSAIRFVLDLQEGER